MGSIKENNLGEYANKLYRGELKRYKEKQQKDSEYTLTSFFSEESETNKKRVSISNSQKSKVIDKCSGKCVICDKKYDPDDFQFHHTNGDPSYTSTRNLVLLCHRCHKKVHNHARAKLKDYKVENKKNPASRAPSSPFSTDFNPFGLSNKKSKAPSKSPFDIDFNPLGASNSKKRNKTSAKNPLDLDFDPLGFGNKRKGKSKKKDDDDPFKLF